MLELKYITENLSIGILNLDEYATMKGISGKRELEKSGTMYLLEKMLDEKFALEYDINNKPYLKNRSEHISISHSHSYLAISINNKEETGIDIELVRDKVKDIQHKFLNQEEKVMANNETEKLITYWAVKESLYKVYGKKSLDFIKHIFVNDINENKFEGRIEIENHKKNYFLLKEKRKNYVLAYILNEI